MAFKMNGMKFYGDRSRKEMRLQIRAERESLKDEGGTRKDVKEFNKHQRKRKKEIRKETKATHTMPDGTVMPGAKHRE
jgi:hypothetical protein